MDPGKDLTPVYPWDAANGWGSRPAKEQPVDGVNLPEKVNGAYTAHDAKPGVATMVLLARPTPLDVPDAEVRKWFEALPDLPLPPTQRPRRPRARFGGPVGIVAPEG